MRRRDRDRRRVFAPLLNADIRSWIAHWNENPPYVWTKTADQILDSLTRYCQRINDSQHQHNSPPASADRSASLNAAGATRARYCLSVAASPLVDARCR
jgi:hypothetical protein